MEILTDGVMLQQHLERLARLSPTTRTFLEDLEQRHGYDAAFTACLAVCNEVDTLEHMRQMKALKQKGVARKTKRV